MWTVGSAIRYSRNIRAVGLRVDGLALRIETGYTYVPVLSIRFFL